MNCGIHDAIQLAGLLAAVVLGERPNADLALYRAKSEGRGTFRFFEPGMDATLQRRRSVEAGLRTALNDRELHLAFQPLVGLAEDRITCFEALLRWEHPERGAISPDRIKGQKRFFSLSSGGSTELIRWNAPE